MPTPFLPAAPGAIIGHTSRGPVRLAAGSDGTADSSSGRASTQQHQTDAGTQQADASSPSQGDTQPQRRQSVSQQSGDAQQGSANSGDTGIDQLPESWRNEIKRLRQEAGERRNGEKQAKDQHQATLDAIAKAIGAKDDSKDPEQLTKQLADTQAESKQRAVELAVYKTASKHSGDPDALLDSRSFTKEVEQLEPTAPNFATQVDQAIKTAVENNPKLRASQGPAQRSSADTGGGSGGQRTFTRDEIANMSDTEYENNRDAIMAQLSGGPAKK